MVAQNKFRYSASTRVTKSLYIPGEQWHERGWKDSLMLTWGLAVYKVGVMGIWFSVPGAMWKARCLIIGMSRWWTIATCQSGNKMSTVKVKMENLKLFVIVGWIENTEILLKYYRRIRVYSDRCFICKKIFDNQNTDLIKSKITLRPSLPSS